MPRVLVYEYLTATGLGRDPASPEHSLYREGRAMRDAIVADFRQSPGCTARVAEEPASLDDASVFDWVVAIAPETGRVLERAVNRVIEARGRPLNGSPTAVRRASDKIAMALVWALKAVPTPHTQRAETWPPHIVPAVVKPRDGAGSTGTVLVETPDDFAAVLAVESGRPMIAQQYVPGRPASVAFLIGAKETLPLLPTFQRLSADGRFRYLGGELPISPGLAERAVRLGRRAVGCVPGLFGYVGVDLVLGDAADGSADYAIEINPRLTTSYVGLRALADFNIASAMLKLASGERLPAVRWKPGRVRFGADGSVGYDPTPGAVFE